MERPGAARTLHLQSLCVDELLQHEGTIIDLSSMLRRLQVTNVAQIMFKGAFGEREEETINAVCELLDMWIDLNKHNLVWLP